jgi:uncharacterized protein (TIGR03435 family)
MTGLVDTVLLLLGGSMALSIVLKATIILAIALVAARLARRRRAAVRHLMIAAAFALLPLLPVAALIGPTVTLEVAVESTEPASPPAAIGPAPTAELRSKVGGAAKDIVSASTTNTATGTSMQTVVTSIWIVGMVLSFARIAAALWQMRRWRRLGKHWPAGAKIARRLAGDAGIAQDVDVRMCPSLAGPVTYGVLRRVIVLPADTHTWADEDVERALVHELEHVRRGDWWTHLAARIVCAIYWFHPLVWVARRRFILEAERACDDAVLSRCESTAYADQLVRLAQRLSTHAHQPMPAMANRRDLRVRIAAVLDSGQLRGPARAASVTLTFVAAAIVGMGIAPLRTAARADTANAITADITPAPSLRPMTAPTDERVPIADAPSVQPAARSARDRIVRVQGQAGAVDRRHFVEATITPCGAAAGGRNGGPGSGGPPSAGVLGMGCRSVAEMIRRSHGYGEHSGVPVEGGPSWVESDEYQITARADGNPAMSVMMGPMLQMLLEDRFKLRLRRDSRNVSGYALTVADSGHKLTEAACDPPRHPPIANLPPPERPCAWSLVTSVRGPNGTAFAKWVSSEEFAGLLRNLLGRPVVDKTGISMRFDTRMEFAPEGTMVQTAIGDPRFVKNPTDHAGAPTAPVIFTAIEEQLGLRLEPAMVPTDVFIVEHVERP